MTPDTLFYCMDHVELKRKLDLAAIGSGVLLSKVKLLDLRTTETAAYRDSRYFPFYYHLGGQVSPERVLQIGPKLGLPAACFLQKCKTVDSWTIIEEPNLPKSMIHANIQMYLKSKLVWFYSTNDTAMLQNYDLALLTEEYDREQHTAHLNLLWDWLKPEGLLVVDYITMNETVRGSFNDFCRVKNREPVIFDTRYGTGIITKR